MEKENIKIKCRDCGEPTGNKTERCHPCRSIWRNKVSEELSAEDRQILNSMKKVGPGFVENPPIEVSHEDYEDLFGRKVESVDSLQCVECDAVSMTLVNGVCNTCLSKKDDKDVINWPKHYNTGKIQPIDAIEDWDLDFRLANAVKYIARHKHKGTAKKDLEKAVWYIQRYIDKELTEEENDGEN